MGIHSRHTRMLAVVGALALGAASTVRAQDTASASRQDTSAAARSDTSGYQSYHQNPTDTLRLQSDSTRKDSSGFKYNGPPTDTTLKAKPGAQTGKNPGDSTSAAGDTSSAASQAGNAGVSDSFVCKDGSRNVASGCDAAHGGIDSASTKASKKARGQTEVPDTRDTSSSSQQQ
jgi:hypothetical protein